MDNPLEGIETLRKLVNISLNTRESAFDGLSVDQCVRLLTACLKSDYDVTPCDLTPDEFVHALAFGTLDGSGIAERL